MVNLIKNLFCRLGWHSFKYDMAGWNGCSFIAQCQWCKGKGLVDSQGNLFSVKYEESE